MNKKLLESKISEYIGRTTFAYYKGDREKAKKMACTLLVLCRRQSREAGCRMNEAYNAIRSAKRGLKLAEKNGVTFPLGTKRVEALQEKFQAAKAELVKTGERMCVALDWWQCLGATLNDLLNLCNQDRSQMWASMEAKKSAGELFSKLVYVYNLDYKDPRDTGWLEDYIDAPLTRCVKEYWLDIILHTEPGKQAAHNTF